MNTNMNNKIFKSLDDLQTLYFDNIYIMDQSGTEPMIFSCKDFKGNFYICYTIQSGLWAIFKCKFVDIKNLEKNKIDLRDFVFKCNNVIVLSSRTNGYKIDYMNIDRLPEGWLPDKGLFLGKYA